VNFLACEGDWVAGATGQPVCTGQLINLTREELQSLSGTALNWDQVGELKGEAMMLFALVFGFLVLKKVL